MSRFDRRYFDYEYGADPWETRIFSGPDDDDLVSLGDDGDDDGEEYPRRSSARRRRPVTASVVSYDGDGGDLDSLRQRHRHHSHKPKLRHRQPSSLRPSRSTVTTTTTRHRSRPTLSPGLSAVLTDRELGKESLKQRLSLDRAHGHSSSISGPYQRARSLSLSRLNNNNSNNNWHTSAPRALGSGHHYYSSSGDDEDNDERLHRRLMSNPHVVPPPPSPPPAVPYYLDRREPLTLSNQRIVLAEVGWPSPPSRPASRSPPLSRSTCRESRSWEGGRGRERDRYERGYQVVDLDLDFGLDGRHGHGHAQADDMDPLRFRLGPVVDGNDARLPNPRVPAGTGTGTGTGTGRNRARSASWDRWECRDVVVESGGGGGGGRRKSVGRNAFSSETGKGRRAASTYRPPGGGLPPPPPQYTSVHALIITWSFHDLRAEDYTAPPAADYVSLEQETARLRATLSSYGYAVHEFLIPMRRSAERLARELERFCAAYAADDTLLIVYYHGHGALDDENELVFSSHDHPENPEWSKAAAAELYAALMDGAACPGRSCGGSGGREERRWRELMKKYERYRPVSSIKWSSIRDTVLSAASDVLLVLDCCAAGGATLQHVHWQPPPGAEAYTKHLFAACGFESSTSDDMTAALCEVLDEHMWAAGAASTATVETRGRSSPSSSSSSPPPPSPPVAAPAAPPPSPPPPPPSILGEEAGIPDHDLEGGGTTGNGAVNGGAAAAAAAAGGGGGGGGGPGPGPGPGGPLTTKRLHQLMEDKLQKRSVGSQPIFKQLLPHDPEQYITLPNLSLRGRGRGGGGGRDRSSSIGGERRGRRGYVLA
ncbi:hypothetical protein VTK26DRAFT_5512 [Humicola hyalothermophila]